MFVLCVCVRSKADIVNGHDKELHDKRNKRFSAAYSDLGPFTHRHKTQASSNSASHHKEREGRLWGGWRGGGDQRG